MAGKDTKNKPKLGLVPRDAMIDIAKVREFGLEKYGDDEAWKNVDSVDFIHATLRHVYCHLDGQMIDPESGLPHLSHALTSLALAVAVERMENRELSQIAEERRKEPHIPVDFIDMDAMEAPYISAEDRQPEDPLTLHRCCKRPLFVEECK